ncbi:hypothetical protein JEQ12_019782 [Ovis aries]|uniref:MAGE domain-containing protein n=1 Tax=Ovis aries TaxID=9940 RepID=A0A836CS08_SHEEP|nr:hypothetical protein JEQ12_019782 [Ovis aries]
MIGSDGPLSTLGCHVIFERAAIFETCCSCDQREESEGSSGVQVRGKVAVSTSKQEREQGGVLPELPCTGDHQELQGAMAPSSPDAGHSCTGSDEGAQGPEEESAVASKAAPSTQSPLIDPLTRKASMLVELLLEKDTKKEPILQHTLLKVVGRKYTQHFPEILRRASKHMELVFGLELMEVYRSRIIYALMYKLNLSGGGLYQGSLGSLRSPEGSSPKIWYRRST